MDLDNAQKETRNTSSDLFKVKNAYDAFDSMMNVTINSCSDCHKTEF